MKNIKLNFLHVCENVLISQDGKISVIGVFNRLLTKGWPAIHPKFSVVTNISTSLEEYIEVVEIISPENKTIAKAKNKIIINKKGQSSNFVADFTNIVFPIEGKYKIRVSVNDKIISEDNYYIIVRIK